MISCLFWTWLFLLFVCFRSVGGGIGMNVLVLWSGWPETHCVAQSDLKLKVLLLLPPKCRGYRQELPYSARILDFVGWQTISPLKYNNPGWQDGSVDGDVCCQALQPEFSPQGPHKRKELSLKVSSDLCPWSLAHPCPHAFTQKSKCIDWLNLNHNDP